MIKKTALFVSESYAVQKQREEVVGRLHIFLVDYLWPKIQISFVKVTEILMLSPSSILKRDWLKSNQNIYHWHFWLSSEIYHYQIIICEKGGVNIAIT